MRCFPAAVFAVAVICLTSGVAVAGGVENAQWCDSNKNAPASKRAYSYPTPDGVRGSRSAHELIKKARKEARAGNKSKAIQYVAACQAHNNRARKEIMRDAQKVINWLK